MKKQKFSKVCTQCKEDKPLTEFGMYIHKKNGELYPNSRCIKCSRVYGTKLYHEKNPIPYTENPECSVYFGLHIAERILSKYFDKEVELAPYGNKGFDFICGSGKKIDVKGACAYAQKDKKAARWKFCIKHNTIADYFLCIAFDNRTDLNPEHIWLIPGDVLSAKDSLSIYNSPKSLSLWSKYEKPIDKVVLLCATKRAQTIAEQNP